MRVLTVLILAAMLLPMLLHNVAAASIGKPACNLYGQVTQDGQSSESFSWAAPTLLSPEDGDMVPADPCHCWNDAFGLRWEQHSNDCSYDFKIALDEDFILVVLEQTEYKPPHEESPTYVVADGSLGTGSCGTTFYWKVRAVSPENSSLAHSSWSEIRSFTVEPGPPTTIHLTAPCNGATNVPLTDVPFTWSPAPHATSYNFTVSTNADLSNPIVAETGLTGTAYTYTGMLEYHTPYYWQVSALKDANIVAVSNTLAFTTRPPSPPPREAPETEPWVWIVITIPAVLVIVVMVLAIRTTRV